MDSSLLNRYINMWVVLSPDRKRVLAFAKSFKSILKKVKGEKDILHFVLPNDGFYSP